LAEGAFDHHTSEKMTGLNFVPVHDDFMAIIVLAFGV
jgi:hypothetical protein